MGAPMRYQPQSAVRLNLNNPLARALTFAWTASAPDINLVTGTRATTQGTAPAKLPYLTRQGRKFIGSGSIDFGNTPETYFGSSSQQTVFTEIYVPDTNNVDGYIFGRVQGAWDYYLDIRSGSQQVSYATGGNSSGLPWPTVSVGGGLSSIQGRPVPIAGTYDKTTSKIYIDGSLKSSRSETGSFSTSGDAFAIGARGGGGQSSASGIYVGLVLIFKRALTDAEIFSISQNPWQLFDSGTRSSQYQSSVIQAANYTISAGGSSMGSSSATSVARIIAGTYGFSTSSGMASSVAAAISLAVGGSNATSNASSKTACISQSSAGSLSSSTSYASTAAIYQTLASSIAMSGAASDSAAIWGVGATAASQSSAEAYGCAISVTVAQAFGNSLAGATGAPTLANGGVVESAGDSSGSASARALSGLILAAYGSAVGSSEVQTASEGGRNYTASSDRFYITRVLPTYSININLKPFNITQKGNDADY